MRQDVSGWKTRLTDELIAENIASGIWRNLTLADQLAEVLAQNPEKVLFVEDAHRLTAAEIDRQARALASALQKRGLEALLPRALKGTLPTALDGGPPWRL